MKIRILFLLSLCVFGVSAQSNTDDYERIQREHLQSKKIAVSTRERDAHTNLYDKIPSGYVGSIGIEVNAPGAFPETAAGVTTVHGYMFRPKMFIGAGVGYMHSIRHSEGVIPIFGEFRCYFSSEYMRRIYPHFGLRLGGQVATKGGAGLYSQAACGFRIPLSEKIAFNLEVGPQYVTKYARGGKHDDSVTFNSPWKTAGYTFGFFGRLALEF